MRELIEYIFQLHPDFEEESFEGRLPVDFLDDSGRLSTFPPDHGIDGAFAASFRRVR